MYHNTAFAYLDPGTGAMIIQGLIGFIAAFIFYIKRPKLLIERIKDFFKKKKKIIKKSLSLNNRILTSILFANIFSIPYFFVGNSYEFAYKSASSVYSSYIVLLIFISLIFYIFFRNDSFF